MNTVLAIDQSTSATKAVLFDAAGHVVDKAVREHRQIYSQPSWVEHDAEEIWQNVLAVAKEVVDRQSSLFNSIIGLSITNQRETCVVFDRRTGRPLHNAIVWQCRRGDEICQSLRAAGHEQMLREKTGLKLDTYFSGSKLKWLNDNVAGIRQKLESGEAVIGTIDAYLIYRLTGGEVFATDHTNASRTLLFDICRLEWDDELCRLFNVPKQSLPDVRESFAHFGSTHCGGAFPKPLPICGVMGDSQASLFAQRCHRPGMAKATFGTGTSVLLNIGEKISLSPGKKGSDTNSVAALAWVLNKKPTYALEGLINYSSATIAWLKDQLGLIRDAAETESLATAVADNGGVYLVPAFAGLSAPYWSNDARAAIVGMSAHSKKEHVIRAALESIAYQIRDVLEMMRGEVGVAPQVLFADGGPTRNKFLMQFTADMIGLELVATEVAEASAWGAAMAGLLGLGIVGSCDEFAKLPRETISFRPSRNPTEVEKLYAG
ncbi:MAG TPA: glycerol kinase GlpK, partial [Pirellulales bacterium]